MELYTAAGKVIDTFTLTAKRPTSIEQLSDQEILDAFDISYDEEKVVFLLIGMEKFMEMLLPWNSQVEI